MNCDKRFGCAAFVLAVVAVLAGCSNQNNPMQPNVAGGIYVMNADGTNQTQISQGGRDPHWRGNRITFSSEPVHGSPRDIYVMNPDGSNLTSPTSSTTGYMSSLSWSPDGSKFAFHRSN